MYEFSSQPFAKSALQQHQVRRETVSGEAVTRRVEEVGLFEGEWRVTGGVWCRRARVCVARWVGKCGWVGVLNQVQHSTQVANCNADVLLILVPFLQDDSGWPLVERSLANNKQLEDLTLDGCDAFLVNMGKALTKNTSIRRLWLLSESLYYLLITHIHCVHL